MKKITVVIVLLAVVLAAGAQKRPKAIVKLEKQLVGEFVAIPAGHYTEYNTNSEAKVVSKREYTFSSFYMLSTEVTNKAYSTFLEDLITQGRMADYEVARVHEECLVNLSLSSRKMKVKVSSGASDNSLNQSDTIQYFGRPAYALHPVVDVSYEGALLFCQWLNEKLGDTDYEYMLPTKAQWQYAAQGGFALATYSCGGPYLTNHNGKPLYKYKKVGDEYISIKDSALTILSDNFFYDLNDFNFSVVNAASFYPNPYGLYNMCGNVAEMVYGESIALGGSYNDPGYDIRIQSEKPYTGPSPMIGFRVIAVKKTR